MTDAALQPGPLPVGSVHLKGLGWWGLLCVILTEGALFGYLLFSYFYFAVHEDRSWLPNPLSAFKLSAPNTVILLLSSVAVWWGERGVKKGVRWQNLAGLAIGIVLGTAFVLIQLKEWHDKKFTLQSSAFGSLYFTITGFHLAHVIAGLLGLTFVLIWSALGYFDKTRNAPVSIAATYWHFVDAVWLTVFFTLYVTPHLW